MSLIARWNEDRSLALEERASRARITLHLLEAADGHHLDCAFSFGIQAVDRPADRKMLEEAFAGASPALRVEDVCAFLRPALHKSAQSFIREHPANELLSDNGQARLLEPLLQTLRRETFTCGLEALAPFQVDLTSPTIESQKRAQFQQQLADRRLEAQRQRMQQSAGVLEEFARLRAQAPEVPAGTLLARFDAAHPETLLETLLIASAAAGQAQTLWIVAGNAQCGLEVDGSIARQIDLPDRLGPCRSVSSAQIGDRRVLLAGARAGVWLIDAASAEAPRPFIDAAARSSLGFNHATIFNDELIATHSEEGVVAWNLRDSAECRRLATGRTQSRHVSALDDRILFASGSELVITDAGAEIETRALSSTIVAILPRASHHDAVIVEENGVINIFDRQTGMIAQRTQAPDRLCTAALLPWLDSPRLLLGGVDGPLLCVGIDDPVVTQYRSAHRGLRALAASNRSIAAISADRQRLILWDSWNGRAPVAEVHLAANLKHRIADLCFG